MKKKCNNIVSDRKDYYKLIDNTKISDIVRILEDLEYTQDTFNVRILNYLFQDYINDSLEEKQKDNK